jgi:signal transduction histidine kinase
MDILSSVLTIESISLASGVFLNLILFIVLITNDKKNKNIYYFAGFIFSMFFWLLTTLFFYILNDKNLLLINTYLIYFAPPFIPVFMILFAQTFPRQKLNYSKTRLTLFLGFSAIISILALIPNAVIDSVVIIDQYTRYIKYGPLYPLYFVQISLYFCIVIYVMIKKYLILQGRERNQVEITFLTLIVGSLVGVFTSLIMPTYGDFSLFWVGSFYSGYLAAATFYGIIKYGLFDIKLVTTEFAAFTTWILLFIKIFFNENVEYRVIDSVILFLIIISSILIIKTVKKEIVLREKDDELVTNITGLNKRLEKTNVQLKELDQKKSEFMSLATHQLRAPLTAMKGYSSMILDGTFGKINNPEIEDAVNKISRSTTDLTMVVEDYLNISRIEQGRMQYNFSKINIVELIQDIINGVKATADRIGLKINLNYDTNEVYNIKADEGKIKQVFLNIIDNAVKYTPSGSIDIYIEKKESEKKILVKIKDTGVGIKKEVLPSLFHKFVRAPDASKVNILGTGLGLYVAGEILKAHKSRAWAESNGEGYGSVFYVELSLV